MVQLPTDFTEQTRLLMGQERFERYLKSFEEEPPVSIRLNPKKSCGLEVACGELVPWCRNGYYLGQRPVFTFDPLFHAGSYYVQEAASMFLDEVLRQLLPSASSLHAALDLCAAPGGKSTLLRSALPADCMLYSNEPVRQRASILLENVTKWGYANHVVTNCYPRDYRKSKMMFDLILCDVPCSGEGMFRKDPATIREWSRQQVAKCAALQREIVSDIWACLQPGGIMIYSPCTFNTQENEENIRWMLSEYDAEVMTIATRPEWNITGSLLEGFSEPVYRFIPGISRGEGLFVCIVKKNEVTAHCQRDYGSLPTRLRLTADEVTARQNATFPQAELSYQEALKFLRGEALVLPADTPTGLVETTFAGRTLGLVKNIGSRANNLYPKPWRIKTTHIPTDYEAILRHT